jgi:hypothetical protein
MKIFLRKVAVKKNLEIETETAKNVVSPETMSIRKLLPTFETELAPKTNASNA